MTASNRFESFLLLTILLLTGVAAMAQTTRDGVIPINGGKNAIFIKPQSQSITPAIAPTAGLIPIYTNLGRARTYTTRLPGPGC